MRDRDNQQGKTRVNHSGTGMGVMPSLEAAADKGFQTVVAAELNADD